MNLNEVIEVLRAGGHLHAGESSVYVDDDGVVVYADEDGCVEPVKVSNPYPEGCFAWAEHEHRSGCGVQWGELMFEPSSKRLREHVMPACAALASTGWAWSQAAREALTRWSHAYKPGSYAWAQHQHDSLDLAVMWRGRSYYSDAVLLAELYPPQDAVEATTGWALSRP